jgi:hypothetical protein
MRIKSVFRSDIRCRAASRRLADWLDHGAAVAPLVGLDPELPPPAPRARSEPALRFPPQRASVRVGGPGVRRRGKTGSSHGVRRPAQLRELRGLHASSPFYPAARVSRRSQSRLSERALRRGRSSRALWVIANSSSSAGAVRSVDALPVMKIVTSSLTIERRNSRLWAWLIALVLIMILPVAAAAREAGKPICAIDMGSNSFRRIVGSFENGRYQQRNTEKMTLGVGDDLARHGRISDPKLADIAKVLSAFKAACEKEGVASVVAIGTAAFREAPNGRQVVEIAASLGIPMEIATEKRESELAYLVASLGQDGFAVVDNGSRSIELVSQESRVQRYVVFNLGYRIAYETFFAAADDPRAAEIAFRNRLRQEVSKASFMKGKTKLVGVEFGEMAEVLFAPAELEGRVFTLQALQQKLREIATSRFDEFKALKKKMDIDRALPRLVVAVFLMEEFGYSRLQLTERELGTGLIIEAGTKP